MQQPPQSGGPPPTQGYTPPPPALRREVAPPPSSGGGGLNVPVILAIAVVAILIIATVVAAVGKLGPFASSSTSKQSQWTAVFLTDNEVFFGHITTNDSEHMVLQNVYYLQKPSSQTDTSTPASINSLVTNQLQCPTDEINIKAANILYWETLQSSSYVVQRLQTIIASQNNTCPQPQASGSATPAAGAPTAAAPTVAAPTAKAN